MTNKKTTKARGPGKPGSKAKTGLARKTAKGKGSVKAEPELDWIVANSNPDPAIVAAREKEEALQDFIDDLIESRRESAEQGDGESLIHALWEYCVNSDRDMPLWLRERTADALRRYLQLHTKTLDQAFRLKPRTGFAAKSRRARHGLMIYIEICTLHNAGVPITQELYHAIGELHGVGRNIVQECYSRELARRGRRVGKPITPQQLPKRLWPIYEQLVTGKRIETRL